MGEVSSGTVGPGGEGSIGLPKDLRQVFATSIRVSEKQMEELTDQYWDHMVKELKRRLNNQKGWR